MSNQKENMLYAQVERKKDKLEFRDPIKKKLYSDFVQGLEEGQVADLYLDANCKTATLSQLAKVMVSIREISKHTGHSFEDTKLEVKRKAGMCVKKRIDGEDYLICKSFADVSKSEMSLALAAITEIGETVGIMFD